MCFNKGFRSQREGKGPGDYMRQLSLGNGTGQALSARCDASQTSCHAQVHTKDEVKERIITKTPSHPVEIRGWLVDANSSCY